MHGPTFMGNALACAAALKSIEIFQREDYMGKVARIEEISRREMAGFTAKGVKEVRTLGACTCIEVESPEYLAGYRQYAYEQGVFARPFLNYVYTMPPHVIGEKELVKIFDTMKNWFARELWREN